MPLQTGTNCLLAGLSREFGKVSRCKVNRREFSKGMAALVPLFAAGRAFSRDDAPVEPATKRTKGLAKFEELQFGVSFHFSMNTFTGDDYDTGRSPASTYNPTNLDVRQWIRVIRDLGARYAVLTTKHQSGFCLWDAADYEYDVAASPNKTDVVAAFVAACREYKIVPGFYYSIIDPHNEGWFGWDLPVKEGYYKLI